MAADYELAALTEDTTPDITDWAYLVDSAGTVDKKVSVANLLAALAGQGYVSGERYSNAWVTINTRSLPQGSLYLVPFFVRSNVTFDRMYVEISTAGTGSTVVRLGIWNHDDSTGKPGTLALDAGTVSGTSLAEVAATISKALTPGWYWLGCVGQTVTGSPAVRGYANGVGGRGADLVNPVSTAISSTIAAPTCYVVTGITGALASLVGSTFASTPITGPIIHLRAA